MGMFTQSVIAVDGSKFKAVNSSDNNYTDRKLKVRIAQTEDRVARYLDELDRADQKGHSLPEARVTRLKVRLKEVKVLLSRLVKIEAQCTTGVYRRIRRGVCQQNFYRGIELKMVFLCKVWRIHSSFKSRRIIITYRTISK